MLKEPVKLTGHKDIDELFISTHKFLEDVDLIQKEIEEVLKYKPVDPFKSRPKWRFKKVFKV